MPNKFVAKRYSAGEIEALQKNPNVLEVKENRLLLTLEFRQLVYEEWVRRPERSTVRRMLEIHGFDTQRLGLNFTKSVESVFKRSGRPRCNQIKRCGEDNVKNRLFSRLSEDFIKRPQPLMSGYEILCFKSDIFHFATCRL